MSRDGDVASEAQIAAALERLARRRGVLRPDLVSALQGELSALRDCWSIVIPTDNAAALNLTQRLVVGNLLVLIEQLEPRRAHQRGFTPEQRLDQYRDGIKAYFNLPFSRDEPEYLPLRKRTLTERREWLAKEAPEAVRISVPAGQDDQAHAISQMAAKIASAGYVPVQPQPEVPTIDDAAVLRAHREIKFDTVVHRHMINVVDTDEPEDGDQSNSPRRVPLFCIYGEPGTGKTTLAHLVLHLRYRTFPEVPRIATLRAGDPDHLRDDITSLLLYEGMDPTNWNDSYMRAMFRRRFSEASKVKPRVQGIIIDDVDDEELLAQLVPDDPSLLIIATMQDEPRDPRNIHLHLGDFDETEAVEFINKNLDNVEEADARMLSQLLGGRPLAVEHAVRFIRESPDVLLRDVVSALSRGLGTGLDLLAKSVEPTRNFVELYKAILEKILQDENVRTVLDSFLAVASSGIIHRGLLYHFLQRGQDGSYNRVLFRSALRTLSRHGLAQEVEFSSDTVQSYVEIVMHRFTFELLRELRGLDVLLPLGSEYYMHLTREETEDVQYAHPDDELTGPIYVLSTRQVANRVRSLGLPGQWDTIIYLNYGTWIGIQKQEDEKRYVIRYEYRPSGALKLDYRTGAWSSLTNDEAVELEDVKERFLIALIGEEALREMRDNERQKGWNESETGVSALRPPFAEIRIFPVTHLFPRP